MEQKQRNPHDSRDRRVSTANICHDCLMVYANHEETTDEHMEAFMEAPHSITDINTEKEAWFSWSPCDNCQSPLGGNRYEAIVLLYNV
jgi:hypothetical protein